METVLLRVARARRGYTASVSSLRAARIRALRRAAAIIPRRTSGSSTLDIQAAAATTHAVAKPKADRRPPKQGSMYLCYASYVHVGAGAHATKLLACVGPWVPTVTPSRTWGSTTMIARGSGSGKTSSTEPQRSAAQRASRQGPCRDKTTTHGRVQTVLRLRVRRAQALDTYFSDADADSTHNTRDAAPPASPPQPANAP